MTDCREHRRSERHPRTIRLALIAGGLACVSGCATHPGDAFLDPSNTGRWDRTPTVVPILERIASIEDQGGESVEYSDVTAEDLVPVPKAYRLTAGDGMEVTIYDLLATDKPEIFTLTVDSRGTVDVPYVGRIVAVGKTTEEFKATIEAMIANKVANPTVSIKVDQQRGQTFHLIGAVTSPGPYYIPRADYRLLEAVTAGGNFDSNTEEVFVIRQVSLSEPEIPVLPGEVGTPDPKGTGPGKGVNIDDLLKGLTNPQQPGGGTQGTDPSKPLGQPGLMQPAGGSSGASREPAIRLNDGLGEPTRREVGAIGSGGGPQLTGAKPPIELQDGRSPAVQGANPAEAMQSSPQWIFVNGRWQKASPKAAASKASTSASGGAQPANEAIAMTQRVIRVPLQQLMNGNQRFNIVVRPGDVVRLPAAPGGFVYVAGQVQHVGAFQLTGVGRMTLRRVIESAGGLSNLGIPERVDLTRMVGRDRQATIMLDLRAIAEGTQPDVFLKPNDLINVGTTWWAYPVAVLRGGFRTNYGFGLLVDRNFGSDVFGVPPESRNRNSGF